MPAPKSSPPSSSASTNAHHKASESFLSRTILAPVLFISFIFSLLIIDRRTSSLILSPPGSPPGSPRPKSPGKDPQGYYHSHQRKLARREVDEAFAIRGKVIVGMCVLGSVGFVGMVLVGMKVWRWIYG
jgi:hypothetical protein